MIVLALLAWWNHNPLAVSLNELKTVALEPQGLTGLEINQRVLFAGNGLYYLQREHNLYLAITKSVELGLSIPWLNYITDELNNSNTGDIKFHLNFATYPTSSFFKTLGLFNFYLEFNLGTGVGYTESNSHPVTSYGFEEWRLGYGHFKKFKYFSIHNNFFYVFRAGNEIPLVDNEGNRQFDPDTGAPMSIPETTLYENITEGNFLNIFNKASWQQWLGFNWDHPKAFFYKKNLENDIIEYNFAINSDLPYPFVPFVELTFSFDFLGDRRETYFAKKAAGAGVSRNQLTIGTKFFFNEDFVSVKAALIMPLMQMQEFYNWGFNLGIKIDF